MRDTLVVAAVALILTLVGAAAACSGGSAHSTESGRSVSESAVRAYGRGCDSAVGGALPAGWRKSSVVSGPLALYSFGNVLRHGLVSHTPASAFVPKGGVKLLALVRPSATVQLVVPPVERRVVSLAYKPGSDFTAMRLADGDAVVTFHACSSPSGLGPGIQGWTQFNGGILVAGARCAKFLVKASGRESGFALAFGRHTCG